MRRSATALWKGTPDFGEGTVSTANGAVDNVLYLPRYTPASGTETSTTPGEMLAAAEASSVARWIAHELEQNGIKSTTVRVTATVNAEDTLDGYIIEGIHLAVNAELHPENEAALQQAAERALAAAPVSRVLSVPVTLELKSEHLTAVAAM